MLFDDDNSRTALANAEDTEITLGTGKMLALFFGLVALCGIFFGLGYKLGKGSAPVVATTDVTPAVTSHNGTRPSAVKPSGDSSAASSPDLAFYNKTADQKPATPPASADPTSPPPAAGDGTQAPAPTEPAPAPAATSYFVQVAAVTKQEDADALVDALKKKQYPAFSAAQADKLIHIQVGPFGDIKSAEDMRSRLINDGYNPILKK